jgi:putative copper resistance protein D
VDISGWDIGAVAVKTLVYAATLGAAGAVFFLAYAGSLLDEGQRTRIKRVIAAQLTVAALASIVRILLLTGSMNGSVAGMFDREMAAMILQAGEGNATVLRLAGLGLAACALMRRKPLQRAALLGAALAAASFSAVGHVRALHAWPAGIFSCLHLLGVAFWLGALIPLLSTTHLAACRQVAAVAARFGTWALAVVSLLIAAGLALLWMLSAGHPDFWSSAYGRMLAAKLLLVVLLLSAAALNKLWLTPRLLRNDATAIVWLRRSIHVEILVGACILALTAVFTSLLGPPH